MIPIEYQHRTQDVLDSLFLPNHSPSTTEPFSPPDVCIRALSGSIRRGAMKFRSLVTLSLILVSFLAVSTQTAFGQAASLAQLNGTVLDESGGAVAKASISVREKETNLSYPTNPNESGFYVVPNLPPGHYELKVSFTGFANYTQT